MLKYPAFFNQQNARASAIKAMTDNKNISEFIPLYKKGQQLVNDLEFENGASFSGFDIIGTTFKNCSFCADFSIANLNDWKFIDSNIKTCDFSNANPIGAEVKGCVVVSTENKGAANIYNYYEDNSAYENTLDFNDYERIFGFER